MPQQHIIIDNHANNSTFGYSLIRLCGQASMQQGVKRNVLTITQKPSNKTTTWEVRANHFKALILLEVGLNTLQLSIPNHSPVEFQFTYQPDLINVLNPKSPYPRVRPVYFQCSDHDGSFLVENQKEPHDLKAAVKKMEVASLLMQSFCAETVGDNKTFALEMDPARPNMPLVQVFHSQRWTRDEFKRVGNEWADGGQAGYAAVVNEMTESPFHNDQVIYFCILGGTFYYAKKRTLGMHTALGGGNMGMFSDVTFHSWATTIDDIVPCWSDIRKINSDLVFDDSAYRGTRWANYATGLGACMHELGHCFGCPHTPGGIMSRGFDNMNRFFMLSEPGDTSILTRVEEKGASWDDSSIDIIVGHEHFLATSQCIVGSEKKSRGGTILYHVAPKNEVVEEQSLEKVHYYMFADSTLENVVGDEWIERHGKNVFCKFKELSRSKDEIMLSDKGRGMLVLLTPTHASWKLISNRNGDWNMLGAGKALFPNIPEHRRILDEHACRIIEKN